MSRDPEHLSDSKAAREALDEAEIQGLFDRMNSLAIKGQTRYQTVHVSVIKGLEGRTSQVVGLLEEHTGEPLPGLLQVGLWQMSFRPRLSVRERADRWLRRQPQPLTHKPYDQSILSVYFGRPGASMSVDLVLARQVGEKNIVATMRLRNHEDTIPHSAWGVTGDLVYGDQPNREDLNDFRSILNQFGQSGSGSPGV